MHLCLYWAVDNYQALRFTCMSQGVTLGQVCTGSILHMPVHVYIVIYKQFKYPLCEQPFPLQPTKISTCTHDKRCSPCVSSRCSAYRTAPSSCHLLLLLLCHNVHSPYICSTWHKYLWKPSLNLQVQSHPAHTHPLTLLTSNHQNPHLRFSLES